MKTRVLSLLLACVLGLSLVCLLQWRTWNFDSRDFMLTQTIDKEDRSAQESDKIVITDQIGTHH